MTVTTKPNVLLILVDDLGAHDVGYSGHSSYSTPNIDQLAANGVVFTQAYAAAAICSPTRAALLSGKHPARLGITNWIPGLVPSGKPLIEPTIRSELPLQEHTIAEHFSDAGYSTFFAGKWHLGGHGYYPENQGFDINVGGAHFGQPPGGYYSPYNNALISDGPVGEYLPDRLTSETIAFLEEYSDRPFFAMLSFYTVHTPLHEAPLQEQIDFVPSDRKTKEHAAVRQERDGVTKLQQDNRKYAGMVAALDANIGRLLQAVRRLDLNKNTIVIFTSDNGGLSTLDPSHPLFADGIPTSNEPLRAGKGWLYEGGIRVPLILTVPDKGYTGERSLPTTTMDVFATILDLTGIEFEGSVDARSLVSELSESAEPPRRALHWHYPHYHGSGSVPASAIRVGQWKYLVFYESGAKELYDLSNDSSESVNLIESNPDLAESLGTQLDEWLVKVSAAMPEHNVNENGINLNDASWRKNAEPE